MKNYALILGLALLAASPSFADNMPVNADGLTWAPAAGAAKGALRSRCYRETPQKTDFMYCV